MKVEVLTFNEETVTIEVDRVADVDGVIEMLGNKFSEVQRITVTAPGKYTDVVLHKQEFKPMQEEYK